MQLNRLIFAILLLSFAFLCLLLVPVVLVHAPLKPDNNESLAMAISMPDPTKSWAIYGELNEGGEAQYYRFNTSEGQRIHVMLFKSANPEDAEFLSRFVFTEPEISDQGDVSGYVEIVLGSKALVERGLSALA